MTKWLSALVFCLACSVAWSDNVLATSLNLSWDSDPVATQYAVEVSTDGGLTWTQIAVGSATTFKVDAPDDGVLYLYRAVNINSTADAPRYTPVWAHDSDWVPPAQPRNLGVE